MVSAGKWQAPERQNAATGDIFGECHAVGGDPTPLRQETAGAIDFRSDEWPHIGGEWAEFLDAVPTGGDGLQGCCG